MHETANIMNVGLFRDELAKAVLGSLAGFAAGKLTTVAYDKFVVNRRSNAEDTDDTES